MEVELKACPFCGGAATAFLVYENKLWGVSCDEGECTGAQQGWHKTKEEAVKWWNTRVAPTNDQPDEAPDLYTKESERERGDYWKGQCFKYMDELVKVQKKVDQQAILAMHGAPVREIVVDVQVGEFAIREFQALMGFDAYRMAIACADAWGFSPGNVRLAPNTDIEGEEAK